MPPLLLPLGAGWLAIFLSIFVSRASSARLANPFRLASSSPHQNRVVVPARAAYSHSASVGRRYTACVLVSSHLTYARASYQLTQTTGSLSVCAKPGSRQLAVGISSAETRGLPQPSLA